MKLKYRKLVLLFVLLDNLYVPIKIGFDFRLNYVLFFLFIVCYPFLQRTVDVSRRNVTNVMVLLLLTLLSPVIAGEGYIDNFKQIGLLAFTGLFALLLINIYNYDLRALIKDYTDLIYLASIVGFVQIVSQIIGFRYGADYSYLGFDMQHFNMSNLAIQSWFQEPSFFAVASLPATFISLCSLYKISDMVPTYRALLIIAALILSFSAVGLFGLMLSLVIIIAKKYSFVRAPVLWLLAALVAVVMAFGLYSIPKVRLRVDDTFALFFDSRVSAADIEKTNLSTYAIYSNYKIALATLMDHPLFGSGLGTYENDYFHYLNKVMPPNAITSQYQLNERDANSLLLRLSAELGLFGLLLIGWFTISNRNKINLLRATREEIELWVINSAMFVLIVTRLLRVGHYTTIGFLLFLMMYYLSHSYYKNKLNAAGFSDKQDEREK